MVYIHNFTRRILSGFIALGVTFFISGAEITKINNTSNFPVHLTNHRLATIVNAFSQKNLTQAMSIPFISIEEYREPFILDTPYIPKKALLVKTSSGFYGIWQNEQGIVYALGYQEGQNSIDYCLEQTLIKASTLDQWKIAKLLLVIEKTGDITLARELTDHHKSS
jgi:hypothetical protein